MTHPRIVHVYGPAATVGAAALLLLVGCSSGGSSGGGGSHAAVVLRDSAGVPLTPASTVPYSPRQTCGACHDVDEVANGYHFQQGRTDANGNIITQDDFFADGRTYIRSPGMYGKW